MSIDKAKPTPASRPAPETIETIQPKVEPVADAPQAEKEAITQIAPAPEKPEVSVGEQPDETNGGEKKAALKEIAEVDILPDLAPEAPKAPKPAAVGTQKPMAPQVGMPRSKA